MLDEYVETVIIGAGQQGCGVAAALQMLGHEAIVLEKAEIGQAWAHERWDSLVVGSGNRSVRLPGWDYDGDDPGGFMPGREVARHLRRYVAERGLRVIEYTPVERVECAPEVTVRDEVRFSVRLANGHFIAARNVVAAVGGYAKPRVPDVAFEISPTIHQLHSRYYRNPSVLPAGGVLVVGAGISGHEIANELAEAGREVYMSVGRHRPYPRTYRGRDMGEWMYIFGLFDDYVSSDSAAAHRNGAARIPGLPVIGVKDGVAELNLGTLADKGVTLVGSVREARGGDLLLDDNVVTIATEASRSFRAVLHRIDTGLRQRGFVAPEPDRESGINLANIGNFGRELDLVGCGITTVIWCTGFGPDYGILPSAALDDGGMPRRTGIFGTIPGLYFAGLPDGSSLAPTAIAGTVECGQGIARQIRVDHILRCEPSRSVIDV
ncbi:flavin-containing monooxygenase [Mycolicibacterium goodii]|uniref:flavin-containing monooxygenase n=1 Tax=Mycolicibacterium goodii TaxID=134601 RepID=UPI001BDD22C5|nr:NAD(P)-binding domain-containing protein [Mycolicibacterium goodii]MBU8829747.1 NAD(P)/FAD-dependent oxidoreductase [Mycolicibacterium goodii]